MEDKESLEYYLKVQNDPKDIRGKSREWTIKQYRNLLLNWIESSGRNHDYTGWNILDVGCREFFMEPLFPGANVFGIDINRYAKEYNPKVIVADAHHMEEEFDPEQFDLIMCIHSLEHVYDIPLVIRNAFTLMKPGGILFITSPMPAVKGGCDFSDIPSTEYMIEVCEKAGFKAIDAFVTQDKFDKTGFAISIFALFEKPNASSIS